MAATDTAGLDSAGGDTATGETGNGGDTGSTDGGCSAATCKGYCVAATGNCVDCIGDAHCGQGYGCVAQKCVPKTGCTVGASQCQTAGALLVCPEGKGWQVIACASGTVCDGGACIKPYCSPGKPACKGHTAGTCNATGTGVDNGTDCKTSGKFCVAGQCKAQVCSPGDSYCDGTLASVCNEQGTGPEEQDDCALMGMMCVDGNCEESPCQGGGLGCVGNDVVQCNAAEVKVVKTCGLSEACYEGQCKPKVCNPGEGKCVDDTTVQFCNDAGTAWDISMNCGTPNGYCENGDCKAMPCPNGGKGCQNTGVVQCNGKVVTVVEDCATKGLSCWNGACAAKVCTPGATQCNGDTMEFCNGSGTGWDPGIPCGAMGMTCFGGQCQKAPCKPGDLGCEGNTVVQCNGPKPTPVQDCGAMGQVCEAGACVNPICTPNDVLCDGTKVMQCNLAGTALIAVDDCAKAGQVCLDGVCAAMPCLPGGKGCKGTDVVQCDGAGKTFSVVEACGDAGGTCANAACMSAACAPGFGKCNGAVVQNCASDGSGWDGGDNCAKAGKNCSEGFCTSKACPPGVAGCQGAQVAACPATGAGWAMTACASGQTCNGGACLTPGCTLPATQPAHAVRAMLWEPMEKDQGCDLDGDGTLDNEAGKFALAIAGQFPQPGGQMTHIALAADAWKTDGSAFAVQLLVGLAAAGQTCSPTDPKASCKVAIVPESYDLTAKSGVCPARTVLADGKVKGNQFTAGGPTSLAHLPLAPVPMLGWLPLKLARVQGEPTAGPGWTGLHKGRLCGAMVKAELISALAKVNPLVFESSGVSLPNIQQALEKALTADIDSDGDGKKDAVSLALRFVGGKVELQGL
ncbi:MAG: hypothetical protein FJ100_17900 [Deltaproteobacteria bacterium]|nr:hypothetical protein [Deltaproteobacteria bacterium]